MIKKIIPHLVFDETGTWYGGLVLFNNSDVANAVSIHAVKNGYLAKTVTRTIPPYCEVILGQGDIGAGTFALYFDGPDGLSILPQQRDNRTGNFMPVFVEPVTGPVTLKKE